MNQLVIRGRRLHVRGMFRRSTGAQDLCRVSPRDAFESQMVHVRWSGEGVWLPLGDLDFGVGYENHTSYPAPGQIILYPGGISETEILPAYGGVHFASKWVSSPATISSR